MKLQNVRDAMIERAIATLEQDSTASHKFSLIKRIAGKEVVDAIKVRAAEIKESHKTQNDMLLSFTPASLAYHERTNNLIALGKRAQGTANHDLERKVSQMSERLEEQFLELVPKDDHSKFIFNVHDNVETWDERWEYLEFRPPLIKKNYLTGYAPGDVMNMAQQEVLSDLVTRCHDPEQFKVAMRNRTAHITSLQNARSAELAKAKEILEKLKTSSEKVFKKKVAKKRLDELKARGDQKATKLIRAKRLTLVDGVFEGKSKK